MNRGNIFNKVLKKEMSGRGDGKKEEGRREKGEGRREKGEGRQKPFFADNLCADMLEKPAPPFVSHTERELSICSNCPRKGGGFARCSMPSLPATIC
jgi:hypothetical protein